MKTISLEINVSNDDFEKRDFPKYCSTQEQSLIFRKLDNYRQEWMWKWEGTEKTIENELSYHVHPNFFQLLKKMSKDPKVTSVKLKVLSNLEKLVFYACDDALCIPKTSDCPIFAGANEFGHNHFHHCSNCSKLGKLKIFCIFCDEMVCENCANLCMNEISRYDCECGRKISFDLMSGLRIPRVWDGNVYLCTNCIYKNKFLCSNEECNLHSFPLERAWVKNRIQQYYIHEDIPLFHSLYPEDLLKIAPRITMILVQYFNRIGGPQIIYYLISLVSKTICFDDIFENSYKAQAIQDFDNFFISCLKQ